MGHGRGMPGYEDIQVCAMAGLAWGLKSGLPAIERYVKIERMWPHA